MDEARRFLRYVTPGLAFAVQGLLLLFILDRCWTFERLKELSTKTGAGAAIALFLTSGGLGYLFSVVHHIAHNLFEPWWISAVDHRDCLNSLVKKGRLIPKRPDGATIESSEFSNICDRVTAWVVLTAIWKEKLDDKIGSPRIRSADSYATALMDHVHSAGSVKVSAACALAMLIWFIVYPVRWGPQGNSGFMELLAIVIGGVLVLLHQANYLLVGSRSERFINEVLSDALCSNSESTVVFIQQPNQAPCLLLIIAVLLMVILPVTLVLTFCGRG